MEQVHMPSIGPGGYFVWFWYDLGIKIIQQDSKF